MSVAVALGLLAVLAPTPARPVNAVAPVTRSASSRSDSSPILFARARAQARLGEPVAAMASYEAGVRAAESPADWALYRRDLAWVATRRELTSWDKASPAERPALVRAFWSERDSRDGLSEGGRLAEHVRRLDVAVDQFRIHPRHGKTPITRASLASFGGSSLRDYIPTQGELDDRGVIFVRQGVPDAKVLSASPSVESWVYQRDNRTLVVHFAESTYGGSSGNGVLIATPPPSTFASICEVDQESCRIAAQGIFATPEMREHFRQRALAAIKALTTTDTAAPGQQ
ncbi:MAG: hypothetical protein ABIZ70_15140 [Gemmatimonadales bacterium]